MHCGKAKTTKPPQPWSFARHSSHHRPRPLRSLDVAAQRVAFKPLKFQSPILYLVLRIGEILLINCSPPPHRSYRCKTMFCDEAGVAFESQCNTFSTSMLPGQFCSLGRTCSPCVGPVPKLDILKESAKRPNLSAPHFGRTSGSRVIFQPSVVAECL